MPKYNWHKFKLKTKSRVDKFIRWYLDIKKLQLQIFIFTNYSLFISQWRRQIKAYNSVWRIRRLKAKILSWF